MTSDTLMCKRPQKYNNKNATMCDMLLIFGRATLKCCILDNHTIKCSVVAHDSIESVLANKLQPAKEERIYVIEVSYKSRILRIYKICLGIVCRMHLNKKIQIFCSNINNHLYLPVTHTWTRENLYSSFTRISL